MSDLDFEHLLGKLDHLCVFSRRTIAERATFIKTGVRHSFAKYLLFPVALRRQFRTEEYDFGKLMCGTLRFQEKLYIIYGVPRKGLSGLGQTSPNLS